MPAAIWRKHRLGELGSEEAATLVAAFEADWHAPPDDPQVLLAVAATGEVLAAAARLTAVHPLRAYDAVQLASALAARDADPDLTRFLSFDGELAEAARAEGFAG